MPHVSQRKNWLNRRRSHGWPSISTSLAQVTSANSPFARIDPTRATSHAPLPAPPPANRATGSCRRCWPQRDRPPRRSTHARPVRATASGTNLNELARRARSADSPAPPGRRPTHRRSAACPRCDVKPTISRAPAGKLQQAHRPPTPPSPAHLLPAAGSRSPRRSARTAAAGAR